MKENFGGAEAKKKEQNHEKRDADIFGDEIGKREETIKG